MNFLYNSNKLNSNVIKFIYRTYNESFKFKSSAGNGSSRAKFKCPSALALFLPLQLSMYATQFSAMAAVVFLAKPIQFSLNFSRLL